eukprot:m.86015 g.86015  ORF g.86015 m.86015 type:complete len:63 (-) comp14446_c0_seq4:33-221(-)
MARPSTAILPYPQMSVEVITDPDTIQLTYELSKTPRSGLGITITGSNSGYDGYVSLDKFLAL